MFQQYYNLAANVRGDGLYHPIRELVQPNNPLVQDIADILIQSHNFITAAQNFVNSFTSYRNELGDYWATPDETMSPLCPVCLNNFGLIESPGNTFEKEVYSCHICGWSGAPLRAGDCDDLAILLCSILRNFIPENQVYCAVGTWKLYGDEVGHMWVIHDKEGTDHIIESTQGAGQSNHGAYTLGAIFNDKYAFATEWGLQEFDLRPLTEKALVSIG